MRNSEILGWLKEYWVIIIAIIGFFYYFYKNEIVKLEKLQNDYFDNILIPFHLQCLKDASINVRKFIDEKDIYNKGYIPSYLFYLAKKHEYDKIRKIMVVDYKNNYLSQKRVSLNSLYKAVNVMNFFGEIGSMILFTLCFMFCIISLLFIIVELIQFFQSNAWSTINSNGTDVSAIYQYIIGLVLVALACVAIMLYLRNNNYPDCYSPKKKIIEKQIKRKLKTYNKIFNDLIY